MYRLTALLLALAPLLSGVAAYPTFERLSVADQTKIIARALEGRQTGNGGGLTFSPPDPTPVLVPAANDTTHQYQDPQPGDQRGPCPGMNALANHGYLPRNGIVNFGQLVQAQKDVYNIDYDLGALLATVAISLDGDPITQTLSLGGKAPLSILGPLGDLLSNEPGLWGHNRFEADTSLTRNDYYLANGDNHSMNTTLFAHMTEYANKFGGVYNLTTLAAYREARYYESKATNPQFYFGPGTLLMYGAASFVYEAFADASENGQPTVANGNVASFFGAVKDTSSPSGYRAVGERIPLNWHRRQIPYTTQGVGQQIGKMYSLHPVLFGASNGSTNAGFYVFPGFSFNPPTDLAELASYTCAIEQLLFNGVPGVVSKPLDILGKLLNYLSGSLNPIFKKNFGCGDLQFPGTDTPSRLI